MDDDYNRKAFIGGLNIDSVPYFEVDSIRPDAIPDRNVATAKIAEEDGEYFLDSKYGNRKIIVNAHFHAPERWDYEDARDRLLQMLHSDDEVALEFEQAGARRLYYGVYETIAFTYKERGFVLVVITYRATQPFGIEVTPTNPIAAVPYQGSLVRTFAVRGSVQAKPRIALSIERFEPANQPRTISVISQYGGLTRRMDIEQVFQGGSTLIIDVANNNVTLNGEKVTYSGQQPKLLGETTITIQDNATVSKMTADLSYNARYL